jgi:predicted DNA-binding transcriptional regulator YafY
MHRIGGKPLLPPGDGCMISFMTTKKQYSQASRVQGILRTLGARQGITIGELSEEFDVTKRTLYRDLKALEEAGYPLISEIVERTTYWKLEPSFKSVPAVTFTLDELMALYFSRKLFMSPGRSPFHVELESAFKKIESALPAKHIARLEKIEGMFTPLIKASKKIDLNKGIFETVQWALLNQNILKLEYRPRKGNQAFRFEVHPYSLLLYKGEFYLLCFVPGKGMRHFACEGIKKAERMQERFEIPENFSISEFLKVPFGLFHGKPITVKVVFDKELSDYIQRHTWHPSQKIKQLKDGRTLLTMTASGKEEIKAWILSFGAKATLISPKPLQEEISRDLSQSLAHIRRPFRNGH